MLCSYACMRARMYLYCVYTLNTRISKEFTGRCVEKKQKILNTMTQDPAYTFTIITAWCGYHHNNDRYKHCVCVSNKYTLFTYTLHFVAFCLFSGTHRVIIICQNQKILTKCKCVGERGAKRTEATSTNRILVIMCCYYICKLGT